MDTEFAHRQMVEQQVRTADVNEPSVLAALAAVEREQFVPAPFRHLAYADTGIPLAHGQRMMTPIVEGRLLQALALCGDDRVLEVGTGSGYLTACLARLAGTVVSIDIFEDFVAGASRTLDATGVGNVSLSCMDACAALPEEEFDAIAVTGSLPGFDDRYVTRLKTGGRLFVIVGRSPVMEARLVVRESGTGWTSTALFETDVRPLINAVTPSTFTF